MNIGTRMKEFMMKKKRNNKKWKKKSHNKVEMKTFQDLIQKFHLEEYKNIIPRHRSLVTKMLESVQGDNYYLMNKPYSQ